MFFINNILHFVLYFIETTLSFRFLLKFFGANDSNSLVKWLYDFTGVFTDPFENIFKDLILGRFTIEFSSLIAIVVYAFVGFVILEILEIFTRRSEN